MIDEALLKYKFKDPKPILIRHNENMTYKVTDGNNKYLLRIYKSADGLKFSFQCGELSRKIYIDSEIKLLFYLRTKWNIPFRNPIKNIEGDYITKL